VLPIDTMMDHRLVELARHDKKNERGEIKMVLLDAIGYAVPDKQIQALEIIEALNYYRLATRHFKKN
ncbi:MAG TPA: hypothetical protein VI731_09855, partial [Bacteroidia bacterium]|nr:hypothetical protein [Bacteroidia bacterium]